MFENQKVSIILPTYREKLSIKKVINDFEKLEIIDEILVINNNAEAGTNEEVAQTSAREIFEPIQGYGSAIMRGLREAAGDLILICEPDDTFIAKDVYKFLAYCENVDIIYGSRTINNFIWKNANMGLFLKWGNWAVAKMIEVLFNTNYLSDVGCTFRLLKRNSCEIMKNMLVVKKEFSGVEMIIKGYINKLRSVQIPVNYKERVGKSSVTGNFGKALVLGIKIICYVIALRLGLDRIILPVLDK